MAGAGRYPEYGMVGVKLETMPAQSIQVLVAALLAATVPALAGTPPLGLLMQALPPGGWDTAWVLVQRETPGAPDPWSQDESFLRLLEDKDLAVIRVAKMKVLVNPDLWSQLGEGRSLLVSRNFKTVVDLAGAVTGDDLVAAMDEGGYKTVKERRDAFLHEHPDHGEMLDEQLRSALGILNARLRTWSGKPGQPLTYGQSITDACVSWETTAAMLDELAAAVRARRSK